MTSREGVQPAAQSVCWDCNGARAVPDDFWEHEDGYQPCPTCVIDAGETWVVWE